MKKPRDIIRLRRWCIRRRGEGVPVDEICTAAQIPRRTFYNWWNRYQHSARYNYERPHMSLNYETPAEVYFNNVPNVMV